MWFQVDNIVFLYNRTWCAAVVAQHSVHPIPGKVRRGHGGGSRRVFRQFAWLEVGSGKMALSSPAHQRVTLAVSPLILKVGV